MKLLLTFFNLKFINAFGTKLNWFKMQYLNFLWAMFVAMLFLFYHWSFIWVFNKMINRTCENRPGWRTALGHLRQKRWIRPYQKDIWFDICHSLHEQLHSKFLNKKGYLLNTCNHAQILNCSMITFFTFNKWMSVAQILKSVETREPLSISSASFQHMSTLPITAASLFCIDIIQRPIKPAAYLAVFFLFRAIAFMAHN